MHSFESSLRTRSILYCAIVLFLSNGMHSCAPRQQGQGPDMSTVRSEISDMLHRYHADIAHEGLLSEFKYLDDSGDFFWVPPGYHSALSYDSVKAILEQSAPGFTQIRFYWDTLQIFPLTDRLATFTGIVRGAMTDTSGITSPVSLIESGTLIRRPDGWKLLCGQTAALDDK